MNDQENIRRIVKKQADPIKINVPLTDTVLSNLMKGKTYEWTLTNIIDAESISVLLRVYGFKGDKRTRGHINKWGSTE